MTAQGAGGADWIPAFAGMTAQGAGGADWIPAFAGMTSLAPAERARREVT